MKISSSKQYFLIITTALLVSACASAPSNYQQLPKVDKLEWRMPDVVPEWVLNGAQAEDEQYLYFVGVSGKHAEEQGARAEAQRDGGMAFVRYSGMEQRSFSEYLRVSSGLSSEVIDATVSGKSRQEELAEAFFSRLKAESFYVERYLQYQGEIAVGSYYKVKALVRVPQSELQAVQQWRAEQERQEQEERARGVRLLAASIDEAHKLAASSQPLAALSVLHAIRNDKDHTSRPELSGEVQRALLLHSELLAGLRLQLLSDAEQSLLVGAGAEPVRVRVWFSYQGQSLPAVGIPLTLLDSNGKFHGNQRSDEQGEAQFVWDFSKDAPGEHTAYISLDTAFMVEAANEDELTDLRARRLRLSATVREDEARIRQMQLLATSIDEAHKLATSSQPLAALNLLQAIRSDTDYAGNPDFSGEVQRALLLHSELLAGLRLQLLSDAEQSLLVGASIEPVRVRVWFSYQGQSLPAVGIPLTLSDSNGKFHGNQRSDEQGEAQFVWDFSKDAPGEHTAYISLDTAFMVEAANEDELVDLRARRLQLRATVKDDLFAEQYWSGDFAFDLRFASDQSGTWLADAPVEVFASCAVRCYVAVYGWDELEQSGQLLLSSQRRLAKQQESQIGSVRFGAGSYRLIALAYTENFSSSMQLNTSLSRDELALLLKQVRAGTFSKVERHWLIDASP